MRRYSQPFNGTPYGPAFIQGDVIGVGYRPRTGTIFFTRNGKKLEDVAHGLKSHNFFPTVGANGPCTVHVNFGQSGFVFIEANVKKWGLAPMTGSLAPPPPYGSEQGSILLESGQRGTPQGSYFEPGSPATVRAGRGRSGSTLQTTGRAAPPTSPGPARSPTDISLASIDVASIDVEADREPEPHFVREPSPPPDYCSQSSSEGDDATAVGETSRRKKERAEERQRLLGPGPRSPTPAYRDVVRERSPIGGRGRSGSAPAGPSSGERRL